MSHASIARAWVFVALALPLTALAARAQAPQIRLANIAAAEGNAGSADAVLTVTLTAAATGVVTVAFATETVDATGGATCGGTTDYVSASGTVQFDPGETSQPLGVAVCGDTAVEADEAFRVRLSNAVGATIQDATGRVTITNDDAAVALPTISINDLTQVEGSGIVGEAFVFRVTLSTPSSEPVTFDVTTSPTTATQGGDICGPNVDYQSLGPSTITIGPGASARFLTVFVCADAVDEPDETFQVVLSNPVNATLGDAAGLGTIIDDDTPQGLSSLSISGTNVTEGNAASVQAVLTVTLTPASSGVVTVNYESSPGSPAAAGGPACEVTGVDFVNPPGTLRFDPGVVSQTIPVAVCGDAADEPDEKFRVRLLDPVGATIATAQRVVTILDDDAPGSPPGPVLPSAPPVIPTLSVGNLTQIEGAVGGFIVSLSAPSSQLVTFTLTTSPLTAAQAISCGPNIDYTGGAFPLFISPGDQTATVFLVICSDTVDEPDETFQAAISNPVNATLGEANGVGTITDDDDPVPPSIPLVPVLPTLSVGDATIVEPDSRSRRQNVNVRLSAPSSQVVSFQLRVTRFFGILGTATLGACAEGADFQIQALNASPTTSLTLRAGQTVLDVPVSVCGDTVVEPDEFFQILISNPSGAVLGDSVGRGTITNNDPLPTLAITSSVAVDEPELGEQGVVGFSVTLSGSLTTATVSVAFATVPGTARPGSTCAPTLDFLMRVGVLTFSPGTATQQIRVPICGDIIVNQSEGSETFTVILSNSVNATIASPTGRATIRD